MFPRACSNWMNSLSTWAWFHSAVSWLVVWHLDPCRCPQQRQQSIRILSSFSPPLPASGQVFTLPSTQNPYFSWSMWRKVTVSHNLCFVGSFPVALWIQSELACWDQFARRPCYTEHHALCAWCCVGRHCFHPLVFTMLEVMLLGFYKIAHLPWNKRQQFWKVYNKKGSKIWPWALVSVFIKMTNRLKINAFQTICPIKPIETHLHTHVDCSFQGKIEQVSSLALCVGRLQT